LIISCIIKIQNGSAFLVPTYTGCPGEEAWVQQQQQQVVSGSGWAICKSAPRPRQITMPESHHSVFYRPDALPAAQPTVSKH